MILAKYLMEEPPSVSAFTDDWQAQFVTASSKYLSMTDANFGAFDRRLFAISAFFNRDSTGTKHDIMRQWISAGFVSFTFRIDSTNKLEFLYTQNGSTVKRITTTATYGSGTDFHAMAFFDIDNGTSADRIGMYVDGTIVSAYDTKDIPTDAVYNSSDAVEIGGSVRPMDGTINDPSFWSGGIPAITTVRNAGTGAPENLTGASNLYSWLDFETDVVTDNVLDTDWTNNNGVTRVST